MSLTKFPNGISSFGIPVMGSGGGIPATTGNYFFASSEVGSTNNDGKTLETPKATYAQALALCANDNADVIVLMPGHAENIATAGAIDANKSGVVAVSTGVGSLRAKFTFTATASTFVISKGNCKFINITWEAGIAEVVKGLDISAVDNLTFEDCRFTDAASMNFVTTMDLATGCDNLTINRCKFISGDANIDHFIVGVAHDELCIYDSCFYANVAQAAVVGLIETSGNVTNAEIKRCSFRSNVDGALFIDLNGTANSGILAECYFSSIDTAGAVAGGFDVTGMHVFECYVAGEANSFGIVGGGTIYNDA